MQNASVPNTCIMTASGTLIDLANPKENTIRIEDIAHAVSMIPRFGGHIGAMYSVGSHCLNAHELSKRISASWNVHVLSLLHDLHEAYVLDVPTPLKRVLGSAYHQAEKRMARTVMSALLPGRAFTLYERDVVKTVDLMLLFAEAETLLENYDEAPFAAECFFNKEQREAMRAFLGLYKRLKPEAVACIKHEIRLQDSVKERILKTWKQLMER